MTLCDETKSIAISKAMIWQAYKRVRANKGSAGIDLVSIEQFETDLSGNLYKLWNRMVSGSYFPPPSGQRSGDSQKGRKSPKTGNTYRK